ncbi:dehydratase [Leifsonia sp. Root227]|uniref:MaoC/PaaZ C-terminal domain-containing protein n=1 Tax=Leifsonia sp. Root227 TaxID=1736496 RepID=UPI0006F3FF87|nr:MaoC/PaaZ C-terminal domain-containing protein [Leifsonia sp. Root227]KRC51981.1 dehydratase [Leifsonia sp. Root227]
MTLTSLPTVTHAEAHANGKDAAYDAIVIPEPFPGVDVTLDADRVRSYAFAQGDYGSWYFYDSPFGGPIGHPLQLANDLLFLFYETYNGNTAEGLQTHERLRWRSPLRLGETVRIEGGYVERYENRGHGYVVMEADARAADGRQILEHRGTEIMRTRAGEVSGRSRATPAKRRVAAEPDLSLPTLSSAKTGATVGSPVAGLSRHFTQDQMNVFSWLSRGYRNVHTDISRARDSGVDRTIVQALQQTGLIAEAMVAYFGPTWFTSGELDLRYTHPAFCDEQLSVNAVLVGESDGIQELEVWIDSDGGARTALGWAKARVTEDVRRPEPLIRL